MPGYIPASMKQYGILHWFSFLLVIALFSCSQETTTEKTVYSRPILDTVGYPQFDWQMDSIMDRINRSYGNHISAIYDSNNIQDDRLCKIAISPHDDYAYASYIYPLALKNIHANTILLFGVAHRAKDFDLESIIVFDSYDVWQGPYGDIPVSPWRQAIIDSLPDDVYTVNDTIMASEHSLEAIIPFLQYYNRNIEIIPILVPYMHFCRMQEIINHLSVTIHEIAIKNGATFGEDFAIVISSDAVHYGDQGWGGNTYAEYGSDTNGYNRAVAHDFEIIQNCLVDEIEPEKISDFSYFLLCDDNYRQYKWTWCGRYSVPFGLMMAYYYSKIVKHETPQGIFLEYSTSIDNEPLPVEDLGMGKTAPANINHWVGYVAMGYY
jgi:AmmeMemoRadiSam system protein B